jgi:hypothetical protein
VRAVAREEEDLLEPATVSWYMSDEPLPGLMSATIVVPSAVPSDVQSSLP